MNIIVTPIELGIAILLETGSGTLPTFVVVIGIRSVSDVWRKVGRCVNRHSCCLELHYQPHQILGCLVELLGCAGRIVINGLYRRDINTLILGKCLVYTSFQRYRSLVGLLLVHITLILRRSHEAPLGLPQLGIVEGRIKRRGIAQIYARIILLWDEPQISTGIRFGIEATVLGRQTYAVGAVILCLKSEEFLYIVGFVTVHPDTLHTINEGAHHLSLGLHITGQIVRDVVEFVLLNPHLITFGGTYTGTGVPVIGTKEEGISIGIVKIECLTSLHRHRSRCSRFGPLSINAHDQQH